MTPEHAAIARDFEPSDLRPLLDACEIDRTILVQSACTDSDTDAMFAHAAEHPWIAPSRHGSISSPRRGRRRGSTSWPASRRCEESAT